MIRKVISDGKEKSEVWFDEKTKRWVWFLSSRGKTLFKRGTSIGIVLMHIQDVLQGKETYLTINVLDAAKGEIKPAAALRSI